MNLQDGLNGFLRICLAVSLSIFEQKAGFWGLDEFAGWIKWIFKDLFGCFTFDFRTKSRILRIGWSRILRI